MHRSVVLALLVIRATHALLPWQYAVSKYDERCTFEDRAYTGIRIFHERTISLSSKIALSKKVCVMECTAGHESYNLTLPSNAVIFNTDLEVDGGSKFLRIVQRPGYQNSNKLKYIPGTIVGAVYEAPAPRNPRSKITEWRPLSPLIADDWNMGTSNGYAQNKTAFITLTTSLLRSPDVLEKSYPQSLFWTELIPVSESES